MGLINPVAHVSQLGRIAVFSGDLSAKQLGTGVRPDTGTGFKIVTRHLPNAYETMFWRVK